MMLNYFQRLQNKLKFKKLDSKQPLGLWIFVIILNLLGFGGYIYLKLNNINLNS